MKEGISSVQWRAWDEMYGVQRPGYRLMAPEGEPRWSFVGYCRGNFAMLLAMMNMMLWYFLFAIPVLGLWILIRVLVPVFAPDAADPFQTSVIIMSPFSMAFLFWVMGTFILPASSDLMRRTGFLGGRTHLLTPRAALEIVRQRRREASSLPVVLFRWIVRR